MNMNHAGQAQRKGKGPYRILLTILTGIAGIALFGGILLMSQSRMAELALQEEMKDSYFPYRKGLFGQTQQGN